MDYCFLVVENIHVCTICSYGKVLAIYAHVLRN